MVDWVAEKLGKHLLELHRIRRNRRVKPELLVSRLGRARGGAMRVVEAVIPEKCEDLQEIYDQALAYLDKYQSKFMIRKSLVHGDLWWSNVIVTQDDVYLIDWEALKTGDYLDDIARFRIMIDYKHYHEEAQKQFWTDERDPLAADRFVDQILDVYREEFDSEVDRRLKFYLVLWCFIHLKDIEARMHKYPVEQRTLNMVADLERYWQDGLKGGR
jgi:thiamine kinase-like enzyme